MIINRRTYNRICKLIKPAPPETGGILGEINGIITEFVFDRGVSKDEGCYSPDVERLNKFLREWQEKDIEFCGMVHSHVKDQNGLSEGDKEYIRNIMLDNDCEAIELYFPVLVNGKMLAYKAVRKNNEIIIDKDLIKLY